MVNHVIPAGDVILITGGCGFLGRSVLRLFLEKGENISEIRILDTKPKPTEYVTESPLVRYYEGDIRNMRLLMRLCRGVDVVVHTASVIDTSPYADMELMHDINVQGTSNVIKACKKNDIEYMVYTSTTEINRTYTARDCVSEADTETLKPDLCDLVMPAYSKTKFDAEKLVLAANGCQLPNGRYMKTLALRPPGIYGECDVQYVPPAVQTARGTLSIMPILGSSSTRMQRTYVGNVAWAHVHAVNQVRKDKQVSGKAYHVTDNSPISNNFLWMKPFLEAQKIKVIPISIPFMLVYLFWCLLECILLLISPFLKLKLPAEKNELFLCCSTATYDGRRARDVLGYTPLYGQKDAFLRSYEYYSKLKL